MAQTSDTASDWHAALRNRDPAALTQPYTAPPIYARWWAEMEACSGLRGDLGRWSFVAVRAWAFPVAGRRAFLGYTFVKTREIWLVQAGANQRQLVAHEMLHALLHESGRRADDHPAVFATCGV